MDKRKKRTNNPISKSRVENLVDWKSGETEEEDTYPGENEDLRKVRESIMSEFLGTKKTNFRQRKGEKTKC